MSALIPSIRLPMTSSPVARAPALDRLSPADPARLLFELVSIASPSCQEADAVSFLVSRMAELGLEASVDGAGNAVGVLDSGDGETRDTDAFHVMLLGHIDTVPGGPAPEIREGVIYGRGAVDAKGPLAVFATVASRFVDRPEPGLRLTVVGAVEEEVSSSKGARFVAQAHGAPPDSCVIGEPSSSLAVTLGYKGRLLVDLLRRRPSSHSAGPEPTATEDVVDAWRRVQDLAAEMNREARGLFAQLQTELQSITTGKLRGDIETCQATFGFRLPPAVAPNELRARLEDLLPDFELTFRGLEPAWSGDRRHALVHAFTGAIRAVAGQRPALKYKTGTSDMNIVGPIWQCPILAYGPGDSRLDHTPNEHVPISEVHLAADVLESALRRMAKNSRIESKVEKL